MLDPVEVRLAVDVPLRHHDEGVRAVHRVIGLVDVDQPLSIAQRLSGLLDGAGIVGLNPNLYYL